MIRRFIENWKAARADRRAAIRRRRAAAYLLALHIDRTTYGDRTTWQ